MILLIAILMLLGAFSVHLVWWRIKMPKYATKALLILFIIFFIVCALFIELTGVELMRLALLYTSCALVYIILYSAVEQQSPTLAIIHYIYRHGENGCNNDDLVSHVSPENEILNRLLQLEMSGWLVCQKGTLYLTDKGRGFAKLFDLSSGVFGTKQGG